MNLDRTPPECLNLTVNYVSHWKYLQGLREFYQNFMDAAIEKYPDYKLLHRRDPNSNTTIFTQAQRNGGQLDEKTENYIEYRKDLKQLILQNNKSFPIKSLLMGSSQKGPESLGKFGEGMKISMIVLLKADIDVIIESGDRIYYPTLKKWDHNELFKQRYNYDVLYVKVIENRNPQDKTKVILNNLTMQQFNEFLYVSLALLDENKYDQLKFGPSTLIIPKDPNLLGKIYKKGVRLELHQSANSQKFLHYSYNFDTIETGRDRDCVNNVWDLYRLQSQLHFKVVQKSFDKDFLKNRPQLKPIFRQHIKNISLYLTQNNYQIYFFHQYSINNKSVCDLFYDEFLGRNSQTDIYPIYNQIGAHVIKKLKQYCLPETFYPFAAISCMQWATIQHSNKYISVDSKIQRDILSKTVRNLTQQETNMLNIVKQKISYFIPEINQLQFEIKNSNEIAICKAKPPQTKLFYINPNFLNDEIKFTRAICKALL